MLKLRAHGEEKTKDKNETDNKTLRLMGARAPNIKCTCNKM